MKIEARMAVFAFALEKPLYFSLPAPVLNFWAPSTLFAAVMLYARSDPLSPTGQITIDALAKAKLNLNIFNRSQSIAALGAVRCAHGQCIETRS